MDILNQVSAKIAALSSGDQWVLTAQDLWLSRGDFQSLAVYLSYQADQGAYSVDLTQQMPTWIGHTSLTVTKH
jgi:hypothetical protein